MCTDEEELSSVICPYANQLPASGKLTNKKVLENGANVTSDQGR